MLESSRRLNRIFKHPYYLYRYWDNRVYKGEQIVRGRVKPRYGDKEFPLPTKDTHVFIKDQLETWVDVDINHFGLLDTSPQDWKPFETGYIRPKLTEKNGKEPTDDEVKKEKEVFIRRFKHFDPFVVRAFSESHTTESILAGKPDKWAALVPAIIVVALVFGGIMITYLVTSA